MDREPRGICSSEMVTARRMSTTIKTNCTDAELSALVALSHGWQRRIATSGIPVDHGGMRLPNHFSNDPIEAWWTDVDPLHTGVYCMPPRFATSADAVLPLLERHQPWVVERSFGGFWLRIIKPHREAAGEPGIKGDALTFPRAACYALLRVHGVEVAES